MTAPQKDTLNNSYQKTMEDMRSELSIFEKLCSRITHAPAATNIFSFLGKTLFNPAPLIAGGTLAGISLLATLAVEILHGYTPSGLEPHLGFAIGLVIGLAYALALKLLKKPL